MSLKLGSTAVVNAKLGASQVSKIYLGATEVWSNALTYAQEVLADSPIAFWRLGESSGTTATDSVGSYPMTYVGSPTLGVTGAVPGNTAITTAAGKYAIRNSAVLTGAMPFTLEAWIKTTSPGKNILVVGKTTNKSSGIATDINGKAVCFGNGNAQTYYSAVSSASVNDGNWHHIVGVIRDTGYEIYVDGSLSGSYAVSRGASTDYNQAVIAGWLAGVDNHIGFIDECAVYPTALSAARIAAHYAARNNA